MRHVTRMKASSHAYERVMSGTRMSHGTYKCEFLCKWKGGEGVWALSHTAHVQIHIYIHIHTGCVCVSGNLKGEAFIRGRISDHIWLSHVTYINYTCDMHEWACMCTREGGRCVCTLSHTKYVRMHIHTFTHRLLTCVGGGGVVNSKIVCVHVE